MDNMPIHYSVSFRVWCSPPQDVSVYGFKHNYYGTDRSIIFYPAYDDAEGIHPSVHCFLQVISMIVVFMNQTVDNIF